MKRIIWLMALICMTEVSLYAQQQRQFTLDDVTPGGSNYFNLVPENVQGLQWWGDTFVRADVENVTATVKGKQQVLFTLEEVNAALSASGTQDKPVRSLLCVTLPWADRKVALIQEHTYTALYDFGEKKVLALTAMPQGAAGPDFCKENGLTAFTLGHNLCIAGEEVRQINPDGECDNERDIVYGQSVHRDEFGIYKGTFWSPKGTRLAFYRMDQSMVTDYPQVNTTTRTAALEPDKYPMAGMTSHKVTVGVYDVASGGTVYLDAGDPTDRYFTNVSWSPDEKYIYIIELNRDQNHAQLVRYDAATGARETVIYEEKHPKYVEPQSPLAFLPWDGTKFIYQSQRDGFNHLYLFDTSAAAANEGWQTTDGTGSSFLESCRVTRLTAGDWLVKEVIGFCPQRREVIIGSTEVSPLQTNVYSVSVPSGKRRMIGEAGGSHSVKLSESGRYVIDTFSSFDVPRVINILSTDGKKSETYFTARDPLREGYALPEITVGTIKAADGETDLYYRLVKPVDFDASRTYPAIIYVYGGPHAQLVTNSRFYGAGGWDLYMAQLGYVLLTVDGRGSSNRGLEFENCTFRHLGVEEMKDQMEGVKLLKSLPYVDGSRIGVYGWSFGGFMTTNLTLTYNDTFKAAVAGGPVIDWKFYEVMYGERYMDTPEANPDGYRGSDLKLKADRLKGRLLVIIGGQDPVCVPQHTFTFLRACIDAGTHPDFFVYPEDGHNMRGHDRVHLQEHITRYFEDYLK